MALLTQTQQEYYQGDDYGNYQFISLDDVINNFIISYVGEEKIIGKIKRTDVAFHAQRALQELSFDTFKSIKSQEITLPPSLIMPLPHDYVNYTKISWSDDSGIKRILYPVSKTSNPFNIQQNDDGSYDFTMPSSILVNNGDFPSTTTLGTSGNVDWIHSPVGVANPTSDTISISSNTLKFSQSSASLAGSATSRAYAVWQSVNVEGVDLLDLSATGLSAASATGKGVGTLRVGLSTIPHDPNITNPNKPNNPSQNNTDDIFDLSTIDGESSVITFNDGAATAATSTLEDIDVSAHNTVFILITSYIESFTDTSLAASENTVDDITLTFDGVVDDLQSAGDSTTWTNYKSASGSSNSTNVTVETSYAQDSDLYDYNEGRRYGLDPQYAQNNGSFYIDNLRGLIHFSSSVSEKTIVLDYISDSLGTDAEMQVHKFAEDAMYKCIAHAILSTSSYGQALVRRLTKEKFAAVRKAKLRLSNLKLEELTQILRGKSKHIKH